jgi:alpha-beta hydrolase superfamily lysophospholipase
MHRILKFTMSTPSYLVFSQHGMVDTYHAMEALAKRSSGELDRVIAPDLGYLNTLFSIEPLIEKVETIAAREIRNYPDVPLRIIGCSLGGVIWTEILTRHPEWWPQVESLVC